MIDRPERQKRMRLRSFAWGRVTTHEERLEIVRRYQAGESMASIGRSLGLTPVTVRKHLIDMGATLRHHPGRGVHKPFPGQEEADDDGE